MNDPVQVQHKVGSRRSTPCSSTQQQGSLVSSIFPAHETRRPKSKPGPATVAGDGRGNGSTLLRPGETLIRTTDQGMVIRKVDGTKVLRKKQKQKHPTGTVYRRPDGKLVRVVPKNKVVSPDDDQQQYTDDGANRTPTTGTADERVHEAPSPEAQAARPSESTTSSVVVASLIPNTNCENSTVPSQQYPETDAISGAVGSHSPPPPLEPLLPNAAVDVREGGGGVATIRPEKTSTPNKGEEEHCSLVSSSDRNDVSPPDPQENGSVPKCNDDSVSPTTTSLESAFIRDILVLVQNGETEALVSRLLAEEKYKQKLEKQLAQAGLTVAEDMGYEEARRRVIEIHVRMEEIGSSDVVHPNKEIQHQLREEYFKLEQDMERYNSALMLTEEYQAEMEQKEKEWEETNAEDNLEALRKIRKHMPVNIRRWSEASLVEHPSPNGNFLPKSLAMRFVRTNALQAIRICPDELEKMHPATIENFRITGLTVTERRALYQHFKGIGEKWAKNKSDNLVERKWAWFQTMKANFKESLEQYQHHVAEHGPPENHIGCKLLGRQCPLRANKAFDYDGDFGWPAGDVYEASDRTPNTNNNSDIATREALELARVKKAEQRTDLLKKHYRGQLMDAAKANGSCEEIDGTMDKIESTMEEWILTKLEKGRKMSGTDAKKEIIKFTKALNRLKLSLSNASQRADIQTTGKSSSSDVQNDTRSAFEISLVEELCECSNDYLRFIRKRMVEMQCKDSRIDQTIKLLESSVASLQIRNKSTLAYLAQKRHERSRKHRTAERIQKELEESQRVKSSSAERASAKDPVHHLSRSIPRLTPRSGRKGLLDAVKGKNVQSSLLEAIRGRQDKGEDKHEASDGMLGNIGGSLLDAIKNRRRNDTGGGKV